MPLTTLKPKISAGQSLSEAFDCTNGTLLTITIPPNWTPANISFQVSSDDVNFYDVVDERGKEVMWTAIAGTCLLLDSEFAWKGMHLKIRYSSKERPVIQVNAVEFTVAIQT